MGAALKLVPESTDPADRIARLEAECARLQELLAQQQRVAQAGLITAGLAHDVDNHIQAITGASFLALRSPVPDDWKRALDKIQAQCLALTETTRAFLGFVRRRDVVGQTEFSMAQALEETRRLVRPMARSHDVDVSCAAPADVSLAGERRLLIQALVNLATNAVRACAESGGAVALHAAAVENRCRIEVRDTGPGIPFELRRKLFRPFTTGHAKQGGSGLGLFIVRQNVRRLGGSIRVESSDDGTVFRIELPLVASQ